MLVFHSHSAASVLFLRKVNDMKLAAIIAAAFALWFISFKLFTRDSDKRCGWHPDGRN